LSVLQYALGQRGGRREEGGGRRKEGGGRREEGGGRREETGARRGREKKNTEGGEGRG
jgi:hypothetical protein